VSTVHLNLAEKTRKDRDRLTAMTDLPPLLLGLVAWLAVVSAVRAPRLEITFPAQHSWWQVSNTDGLLSSLPIYFETHNFRVPDDGFLFVTGDSVPDEGYRQSSGANSLILGGIDPGTHFWKLELRSWSDSSAVVAEVTLHAEVVVNPSDERSPWKYTLRSDERRPRVLVNTKRKQEQCTPSRSSGGGPLPVCYVFSTSAAFDGQRRMWLQVMEGLGAGPQQRSAELQFSVKTFENVVQDAPLTKALRQLNVSLHGLPLEVRFASSSSGPRGTGSNWYCTLCVGSTKRACQRRGFFRRSDPGPPRELLPPVPIGKGRFSAYIGVGSTSSAPTPSSIRRPRLDRSRRGLAISVCRWNYHILQLAACFGRAARSCRSSHWSSCGGHGARQPAPDSR
jgi:hypothetical protein